MTSIRFIDALLGNGPPSGDGAARPTDAEALDAYSLTVTSVAELLIPSVASLKVSRRTRGGRSAEGAGSGVVITPDGFLITSAHVIAGAGRGSASFTDGRELDVEIIGADPLSDLAVIRAQPSDLPPATLAAPARCHPGLRPRSAGTRAWRWSRSSRVPRRPERASGPRT